MIFIHPVHRRLAELELKASRNGGHSQLSPRDKSEMRHCLAVNAKLIQDLDGLHQLSYVAYTAGDMGWVQEVCAKLEDLGAKST